MAQDARLIKLRTVARLSNGFMLDLVKLGGFGRDVIDGVLLTAISQANVLPITRDPVLQRRYAALDQPPPDELRRPVSISAVANSLRIPFETARRRISAMAKLEIVRTSSRGVIIPQGPMDSPLYRILASAHYELVRNLYLRTRPLELVASAPSGQAAFSANSQPVRLVNRLSAHFLLRLAEPLTEQIGDLVTALILLDVIHANTEHLSDAEISEIGVSADGYLPDGARRPVRINTLAERLGIPPETVRRHVNRLVKSGRCERREEGYLIPSHVLARGPFVQYMLDNQSHLQRFFSGLSELGVLSLWDAEADGLRGAA